MFYVRAILKNVDRVFQDVWYEYVYAHTEHSVNPLSIWASREG